MSLHPDPRINGAILAALTVVILSTVATLGYFLVMVEP